MMYNLLKMTENPYYGENGIKWALLTELEGNWSYSWGQNGRDSS